MTDTIEVDGVVYGEHMIRQMRIGLEHLTNHFEHCFECNRCITDHPDEPPKSPAEEALDEIAVLCGIPEWEYPGQVVRDVMHLQKKHADELEQVALWAGNQEGDHMRDQIRRGEWRGYSPPKEDP